MQIDNTEDILDNNLSSRKRKTHNGTPNRRQCLQTEGSQGMSTLRDYSNYRSRQTKKPQQTDRQFAANYHRNNSSYLSRDGLAGGLERHLVRSETSGFM